MRHLHGQLCESIPPRVHPNAREPDEIQKGWKNGFPECMLPDHREQFPVFVFLLPWGRAI